MEGIALKWVEGTKYQEAQSRPSSSRGRAGGGQREISWKKFFSWDLKKGQEGPRQSEKY